MLIVVLLRSECVDDTHKVFALEGCAADEAAVDIGLCKELACVAGFAATAIEYGGVFCYIFAVFFGDDFAHVFVDFLSLFGSGGLAVPMAHTGS